MASGKALIGLSAGVIGLSLLVGGPVGASFAATLLTGLALAAMVAALIHFSPRMHFGVFPSFGFFHRPWFGGGLHTRSFVPAARMGTTAHSSTFVPAATASYTPGWGASMRSGFGSFASGMGHTVHTGHTFIPRRF